MIICYTVPEIWHVMDVIAMLNFLPFYPLTAQKIKIKKKNALKYDLTHAYQKLWSDDVQYLRYGARQINERSDSLLGKVTYRSGCPT